MPRELSVSHRRWTPAQLAVLAGQTDKLLSSIKEPSDFGVLEHGIGLGATPEYVERAMDRIARGLARASRRGGAMDAWAPQAFGSNVAAPATITTASVVTPIQFLQNWLPGFIRVLTAARKGDLLMGMETIGSWEDEWVVAGLMEPMGAIDVYRDNTNIPLSDYNPNWQERTVIRFESGILVGRLEQARAARAMINSDGEKRGAAALRLDIWRNLVAFYGFNSGSNSTYGFLNDPGLLAYTTVAAGAVGLTWAVKTYLEIVNDLITAFNMLQTQSEDNIDPYTDATTLALPMNVAQYLSKPNELGTQSVKQWLNATYPKCRVETAPQLDAANGGSNVFYLYADTVEDGGTDDKRTWAHVVPVKFMALGVEQRPKSYIEDYTNATAGAFLKRPYAVTRWSGI